MSSVVGGFGLFLVGQHLFCAVCSSVPKECTVSVFVHDVTLFCLQDHVLSAPLPRVHCRVKAFGKLGILIARRLLPKSFPGFAQMPNSCTSCSWSEFWALRTVEKLNAIKVGMGV